jgi:hypothetical protein
MVRLERAPSRQSAGKTVADKRNGRDEPGQQHIRGDKDEARTDPDQAGALSFTGTPLSLNSDCSSPA